MKTFFRRVLAAGSVAVGALAFLGLGMWAAGRFRAPRAPVTPPAAEMSAATPIEPVHTPTPAYEPVTWKELVAFITEDHTNWQDYEPDEYICLNFAIDLAANAHERQIPAWVTAVYFEGQEIGHAFVAFLTSDKGMVYIEPQTDIPYIQPQVGRPLCDLWSGQNCLGVIASLQFFSCDRVGRCVEVNPPQP